MGALLFCGVPKRTIPSCAKLCFDGAGGAIQGTISMSEYPQLRFAYITLPSPAEPVLNIMVGDDHRRYQISRDQLFNLNAQIADALIRGRIADDHHHERADQLALRLDS